LLPFTFTSLNIKSAGFASFGVNTVSGPLYLALGALLGIYFIWSVVNSVSSYRAGEGLEKDQLKYLFFGFSLLVVFGVVADLLFVVIRQEQLSSLGPISTTLFVGFTSYAIVRHRLLDIRLVIARTIAYGLLLITMGGVYAAFAVVVQQYIFKESTPLKQSISSGAIAFILAFAFQPLRRFFERVTDSVFFRNRYNQQAFLEEAGKIMASTILMDDLLTKLLQQLMSEVKIESAAFIIFSQEEEPKKTKYLIKARGQIDTEQFSDEVIGHLLRGRHTLFFDELPEGAVKGLMRSLGISIAVPLMASQKEIVGLLLLGGKLSGDAYSTQDIQTLEILAPEASVAIQNAESYLEIEAFNETLKLKVERATMKLREANSHLRELDKAKDEFISMASHQLRTPLTTIKGYLSMLEEGDAGKLTSAQDEFANEAFASSERMNGLINDLLNVSRMDAGRFQIQRTAVDLQKLVEETVRSLIPHAQARHIYLKFVPPGRRVPVMQLDEDKTRQVVMNFIDNAVYYTEKGGVTVILDQKDGNAEFTVHDTGIGVPEKVRDHLFTKFYRADNAKNVRPDGTGLGLYLAKRVVEDQGGKIIFESVEGKGSTFGFAMPLNTGGTPGTPEQARKRVPMHT
jgi:signal transduction histidine kinase